MIDVLNSENEHIIEIKILKTLSKADLEHLKPVLKSHIAEVFEPKLLLIMEEFSGWDDAGAFFKELQLDAEFIGQFKRIALAGDAKWEGWLTKLVNPITSNEIKFFDFDELPRARKWLEA